MPLVKAKCTNCGANLEVDSSKDAAICPYCKTAYIVEKAITNFAGSNYGNINASVVNIYNGIQAGTSAPEKKGPQYTVEPSEINLKHLVAVGIREKFFYSSSNILYLKSDGTLGYLFTGEISDPQRYQTLSLECIDSSVFLWKNIKKFVASENPDKDSGLYGLISVVALTNDGDVLRSGEVAGKVGGFGGIFHFNPPEKILSSVKDIVDIGIGPMAIKNDGTVVLLNKHSKADYSNWKNIKEVSNGFGITEDGRVAVPPNMADGWEKQVYSKYDNIVQMAWGYGSYYGLRKDGKILYVDPLYAEPQILEFPNPVIEICDYYYGACALLDDGSFVNLNNKEKKEFAELGNGFCQLEKSRDYYYFLHIEERIDSINHPYSGFRINRRQNNACNAISVIPQSFDTFCYVTPDGFIYRSDKKIGRLFTGSAEDYVDGKLTSAIKDNTISIFRDYYQRRIDGQHLTFKNRKTLKPIIDEYKKRLNKLSSGG